MRWRPTPEPACRDELIADYVADRPRLLDLFCGSGGAAMGYHRAGFEVVGVDVHAGRLKWYPFECHQGDALTFPLDGFDYIHASPPCQRWSSMTGRWGRGDDHPNLVGAIRERLTWETDALYVLENVPGAPLRADVTLCGKMFDLPLVRHRIFELGRWKTAAPEHRRHEGRTITVAGKCGGTSARDGNAGRGLKDDWQRAMGIDWMPTRAMAQAIPPVFTKWIGDALIDGSDGET